ncbi:hypothetical protein TeGR_g939, partial [Tetraparma gracilis]
ARRAAAAAYKQVLGELGDSLKSLGPAAPGEAAEALAALRAAREGSPGFEAGGGGEFGEAAALALVLAPALAAAGTVDGCALLARAAAGDPGWAARAEDKAAGLLARLVEARVGPALAELGLGPEAGSLDKLEGALGGYEAPAFDEVGDTGRRLEARAMLRGRVVGEYRNMYERLGGGRHTPEALEQLL